MGIKGEKPTGAINVKFWAEPDLLAWLDNEAERRDRSRGYLLNEAIRKRRQILERGRKRKTDVRPVDDGGTAERGTSGRGAAVGTTNRSKRETDR